MELYIVYENLGNRLMRRVNVFITQIRIGFSSMALWLTWLIILYWNAKNKTFLKLNFFLVGGGGLLRLWDRVVHMFISNDFFMLLGLRSVRNQGKWYQYIWALVIWRTYLMCVWCKVTGHFYHFIGWWLQWWLKARI